MTFSGTAWSPVRTLATIDTPMTDTPIELILGEGCCIECAARHEYERISLRIMTSPDDPGPEEQTMFQLILDFLEQADFARLRSSDPRLSGMERARCILYRNDRGVPAVYIKHEENSMKHEESHAHL